MMKKITFKLFIGIAFCAASIQGIQAQCIATNFNNVSLLASSNEGGFYTTKVPGVNYYSVHNTYYVVTVKKGGTYQFVQSLSSGSSIEYFWPRIAVTDGNNNIIKPTSLGYYYSDKDQQIRVHVSHNSDCSKTAFDTYKNLFAHYLEVWTIKICVPAVMYVDADKDGYGVASSDSITNGCEGVAKSGYSFNKLDCNDAVAIVNVEKDWFPDNDGDGYGQAGVKGTRSCSIPNLRIAGSTPINNNTDCDDTNPNVNPGVNDNLTDNADANCDGSDTTNNALNFDGSLDVVSSANLALGGKNAFTIETWIKPFSSTTTSYITGQYISTGTAIWKLSSQESWKKLNFGLSTSSGYSELVSPIPDSIATDGKWHYVVAAYDGAKKFIYLDGKEIGTEVKSGTIITGGSIHNIGVDRLYNNGYNGNMDEIRYWSRALTSLEIKNSVTKEKPSVKTDLLLQYTFNQGFANGSNSSTRDIIDASGNSKNGQLNYFAMSGSNSNFVSGGAFVFVPSITTGTEDDNKITSFSLYPNPSNGTFSVSSTSELGNVSVLNSLGTIVYQNNTSAKQLNIELPSKEAGIYFVKVGNKMTKLVKE